MKCILATSDSIASSYHRVESNGAVTGDPFKHFAEKRRALLGSACHSLPVTCDIGPPRRLVYPFQT